MVIGILARRRGSGPRRVVGSVVLALTACLATFLAVAARAQQPAPAESGALVLPVGGAAARLGGIEIDRKEHTFRVTGTVKRLAPPLEYLAVARGGMKAYESLLELDVGGRDFNAACILIGLEPPASGLPGYQFDRQPIGGQAVGLRIGWETASGPLEIDAGRALTFEGREAGEQEWGYIGSQFADGGQYRAEEFGTLIGLVHDPASVIEHRQGLGLGAYGSVAGNERLVPPPGTKVWIRVTRVGVPLGELPAKSEGAD